MARRKLTSEEKNRMIAGAKKAKEDRGAAQAAVSNPQLQSSKFWAKVDYETAMGIRSAIDKGLATAKQARIKALEAELALLRD